MKTEMGNAVASIVVVLFVAAIATTAQGAAEKMSVEKSAYGKTADGKPVCSDTREITFHTVDGVRAIDFEITIRASEGDVKFKDDKHGSMVIRTHPNLRLDNAEPLLGCNWSCDQGKEDCKG